MIIGVNIKTRIQATIRCNLNPTKPTRKTFAARSVCATASFSRRQRKLRGGMADAFRWNCAAELPAHALALIGAVNLVGLSPSPANTHGARAATHRRGQSPWTGRGGHHAGRRWR